MTYNIFWIDTNKISLVTNEHTPAVQKATTKYALFKFMTPKKKMSKETIEKIEKIQKQLSE